MSFTIDLNGGAPWGFAIAGGVDKNQPVTVSKVGSPYLQIFFDQKMVSLAIIIFLKIICGGNYLWLHSKNNYKMISSAAVYYKKARRHALNVLQTCFFIKILIDAHFVLTAGRFSHYTA
jgi:hypothetical protein